MRPHQGLLGRRLLAALIDFFLVPIAAMMIMLVTGVMEGPEAYANGVPWLRILLLGVAGYVLTNGWLLWRRGQTVGKWLLDIKIVQMDDPDARPPLWKLVGVRALFFGFPHAALIGFWYLVLLDVLPIFWSSRRCLHDVAAGTQVVRRG